MVLTAVYLYCFGRLKNKIERLMVLRNMLYNNRLLLISAVALLSVNSCKNDGCDDPLAFNYDKDGTSSETCIYEPKQVSFKVTPVYDGLAFNAEDTLDIDDGRNIVISYYGAYLSNLSFKEEAEEDYIAWGENDVMLAKEGQLSVEGLYLNRSEITGFKFDIGVDTAIYNGDPMDTNQVSTNSPLAIQIPSMYWGWAGGYRFISVEGMVDVSAAKDGSQMMDFAFHCGLPANLKTMTFEDEAIDVVGNKINLELEMELKTLFEGIDFENDDLVIHDGAHPVTIKMMNTAINAFELK